jgi:hypothetical protein
VQLGNPSRLFANPPLPIYPIIPNFMHQPLGPSHPSANAPSTSTNKTSGSAAVITNPQTFVVSLGGQTPQPAAPPSVAPYTGMYHPGPPSAQYPTTPYYPYPQYHPFYPPNAPQVQVQAPTATPPHATVSVMPANAPGVNQGAWSEEETERLKKLAEEGKAQGSTGEIEWDWVVNQWGNGRTRLVGLCFFWLVFLWVGLWRWE